MVRRLATQPDNPETEHRWRDISKEEYSRVVDDYPTTGRIYHHLAVLERPHTGVSPDENFDAIVSQFFYYTKSLVVKVPFFRTRESVLTVIEPIMARNEKAAEKPANVPQTDNDHFLTAVAHLILASLEPNTPRENGCRGSRKIHLEAVYTALGKIKVGADGPVKTSRIRPRYVLAPVNWAKLVSN